VKTKQFFSPKDGGSIFLRNVGTYLQVHGVTAQMTNIGNSVLNFKIKLSIQGSIKEREFLDQLSVYLALKKTLLHGVSYIDIVVTILTSLERFTFASIMHSSCTKQWYSYLSGTSKWVQYKHVL
jgi:hypothetical protein